MQKEILAFIIENNLSPFVNKKTLVRNSEDSIYKTKDAKAVHNKLISQISQNFLFSDTNSILDSFYFTDKIAEIKKRQEFFKTITKNLNNSFLREIQNPKPTWSPKYEVLAITSNEKTFMELKQLGCPTRYVTTPDDIRDLESVDIIQAVDCDELERYLEQLNQTIMLNSTDDVYLERYLETLSGWKKNLDVIENNTSNPEIKEIVTKLKELLALIDSAKIEKVTTEKIEQAIETINENISERIKTVSISGKELFEMLSKGSFSKEIYNIIDEEIEKTGLDGGLFNKTIPVALNEEEADKFIRKQDSNEFVSLSEKIKRKANELKQVPEKLEKLEHLLLLEDFYSGISQYIKEEYKIPEHGEEFLFIDSKNLFLDKPQPISFLLNNTHKCSILTGANSGGKTTLLEHIIQLISLFQLGLPVSGEIKMPLFTDVYYFAKNKGSISKGAFETLLTQMSKINPGKQTIILADEIESVTEPGVAGKVLCATAEYFIKKSCYVIIATHLGQEIQKSLPQNARIDGIEAKGLDENYELIVNHNPVLGRLAHSTPELIIEKMARSKSDSNEYINYVFGWIKK